MILKQLRRQANRLLAPFGLKLARTHMPSRTWTEFFTHVKQRGFEARTIIDVGVFEGTPELYDAFPKAKLILFEPNPECEPKLEKLARSRGTLFPYAAGAYNSSVDFWTRPNGWSSMSDISGSVGKKISVPIVRIDHTLSAEDLVPPVILKIDAEGFEMDVLEGCHDILNQVAMIIMETRFIGYHENTDEFAEVITKMNRLSFVVYDMLDGYYRPDGILDFIDLVFVKKDGTLRPESIRDLKVFAPLVKRLHAEPQLT